MTVNIQRKATFVLASCAVAAFAGCRSTTGPAKRTRPEPALVISVAQRAALSEDLRLFAEYAESQIVAEADDIEKHLEDAESRRAVLLWKIEVISELNVSRSAHEPIKMLVDTWTLFVRLVEYLTIGDGKDLFGEHQQEAIAVVTDLRTRIEALARRHIPEDILPEFARQADAYAKAHPIRGVFVLDVAEKIQEEQAGLIRLLKSPFSMVGSVGERLDPTLSLAQSIDRFTALMEDYPSLVRWHAQLLVSQIEQTPAIKTTTDGIEKVSASAERLSQTAEQLPGKMREEVGELLVDVDAMQPRLAQTIREGSAALETLNESLARMERVSATIERSLAEANEAGQTWRTTADAVTETVKQIQQFGKKGDEAGAGEQAAVEPQVQPSDAETRGKFDILEYEQTAVALGETTKDLRALVGELHQTLDEDVSTVQKVAAQTLDQTAVVANGIVNHLTWRGIQISAVVFFLALAYRLIVKWKLE
ncbi:MAG: hypothetical protein JSU86_09550 [Phycisphaerales bacterium]|nr:MAG: hypothetical protein JSU86_09550 [Phycisphaerales bacterium]